MTTTGCGVIFPPFVGVCPLCCCVRRGTQEPPVAVDVTPSDRFRMRVKSLRKAQGLSQDDLVAKMSPSMDRATLSRLEAGHRRIDLDMACAICAALGQSLEAMCSEAPLTTTLTL